jgi:methylisocitrate lyase
MNAKSSVADRCRVFRKLHESGCFVIPNPWDAGSARLLEQLGFPALATTSSGFAWSLGKCDNHVMLPEVLAHLRAVAQAVKVPVNADFEGGFAIEPAAVAANVAAATATGIAGLSIEDSTDFALAVERIRAARRAIDESRTGILLTGRSEGFIAGRPDLAETIRRLTAYAEAGADCLYAPGIRKKEDIAAVVKAVAPKPVNLLVGSDFISVAEAAELGVRRISVGGALARAAWTPAPCDPRNSKGRSLRSKAHRDSLVSHDHPRAMAGADRRQARLDARCDGLPALRDGHRAPEGVFPFRRCDSRTPRNNHAPHLLRWRAVLRCHRRSLRTRAGADIHRVGLFARLARRGDVADADATPAVARTARTGHGR